METEEDHHDFLMRWLRAKSHPRPLPADQPKLCPPCFPSRSASRSSTSASQIAGSQPVSLEEAGATEASTCCTGSHLSRMTLRSSCHSGFCCSTGSSGSSPGEYLRPSGAYAEAILLAPTARGKCDSIWLWCNERGVSGDGGFGREWRGVGCVCEKERRERQWLEPKQDNAKISAVLVSLIPRDPDLMAGSD